MVFDCIHFCRVFFCMLFFENTFPAGLGAEYLRDLMKRRKKERQGMDYRKVAKD